MWTAAQIRAARTLVGLTQADVAKATGLSIPTIKRVESERRLPVSDAAYASVVAVLEKAGVEFTNGGEPGVKLRKTRPARR